MDKSFVSTEQKICKVTGKVFDVGVLLDKRLKDSLDKNTITGWGFSPEVEEKLKEGYVALVAVDEAKSTKNSSGNISLNGAYRTGKFCYIKKKVLEDIVPTLKIDKMGFTDEKFLNYLQDLQSTAK